MNLKDILAAAANALKMIEGTVNIPIVKLLPYVGTVRKFVEYGTKAVEFGQVIEPTVTDFAETWAGGLPSEEKRAALDVRIASNHAKIQAFNPVAEEGEEE